MTAAGGVSVAERLVYFTVPSGQLPVMPVVVDTDPRSIELKQNGPFDLYQGVADVTSSGHILVNRVTI